MKSFVLSANMMTSSKYTSHMKYINPASMTDAIISWKCDGARLGPNGSRVNWNIQLTASYFP
jgi:hypothetical protein